MIEKIAATLVGAGNPMPGSQSLPYARVEVMEVARHFDARHRLLLFEEDVTKTALIGAFPATYVHLACHGTLDLEDPLKSQLQLAGDDTISLRDILQQKVFADTRLVVLSSCESAITGLHALPDEVLGLPASFLEAGVSGIIGSQWLVNDLSTALLMGKLYASHFEGPGSDSAPMSPQRALQHAQQWLRDVTVEELMSLLESLPRDSAVAVQGRVRFAFVKSSHRPFEDPFYWAPFVFVGA